MARRHSSFRGRGQRRETSWLDIEITAATLGAGAATITHQLSATELAKRPFTIVRTYLEVLLESDQIVATERQLGAVGICVVSDQAVAIGITAVPTPDTDLASDLWLLNKVILNKFTFSSAVGIQTPAGTLYSIDSKAMRKVNDDQDVVIVAELTGGSLGGVISLGGRILIKEH